MLTWTEFAAAAPRIATVFTRRHRATGNLCFLGTLRSDGYPRISPMEPRIVGDELCLVGMPGTAKFSDLTRDPRFTLHTATVDTHVGDGDAKVWGTVVDLTGTDEATEALKRRFADELFAGTGFDLRGETFDHFFLARLCGAAAVEITDGHLDVTTWRDGGAEHVTRKH